MSRMPSIYRAPWGGPLRWQDDQTGVLPAAVNAYIVNRLGRGDVNAEQLELVRDYCEYYVNAPCWKAETMETQFYILRTSIKKVTSSEDLAMWIRDCLDVGLDPL